MADKYKRTAHTMASPSQVGKATAKSNIQAGKPKAAGKGIVPTTIRQVQNKGVKDGTVRLGAGGKYYNVYDAKSGTWKRAQAAPSKPPASSTTQKPKVTEKPKVIGQVRPEAANIFRGLKAANKGDTVIQNGKKFVFDGKVWQFKGNVKK